MSNVVAVIFRPRALRALKTLRKQYRHIEDDIKPVIDDLKAGNTPGDRIQNVDSHEVYKVRVPNRDAQRGKSGGYRLIYYVRTQDAIYILQLYFKSDQSDVKPSELLAIIEELESELKALTKSADPNELTDESSDDAPRDTPPTTAM